jgi:hypothetical protein
MVNCVTEPKEKNIYKPSLTSNKMLICRIAEFLGQRKSQREGDLVLP